MTVVVYQLNIGLFRRNIKYFSNFEDCVFLYAVELADGTYAGFILA